MKSVVVKAAEVDALKSPVCCSGCCAEIDEANVTKRSIRYDRTINFFFHLRPDKFFSVGLCKKCCGRDIKMAKVMRFGWWMAGICFLADKFGRRPSSHGSLLVDLLLLTGLLIAWISGSSSPSM